VRHRGRALHDADRRNDRRAVTRALAMIGTAPALRGGASLAMAVAALVSLAPRAQADHDEISRATDDTAYTLEGGRLRVGLWKVQYGVFDFATVGTYTLPWVVLAATAHAKLRLISEDPITAAVQVGFAYFDSARLRALDASAGRAIVTALPLEAYVSYRVDETFTLGAGAGYTEVGVDGALWSDAFAGAGEGASDNLQLIASAEVRLSRVFALVVIGRWLLLQRVFGRAKGTLHPDAFTTVVVNGDAAASEFSVRDAYSVVPSVHMSWGWFNLRVGVGYGNFNVPLVNFVLPDRTLIPELDLFFVL
jgi:hypothetical protein